MPLDPIPVVLQCTDAFRARARYVFDTFFMTLRLPVTYPDAMPEILDGVGVVYSSSPAELPAGSAWVRVFHSTRAAEFFDRNERVSTVTDCDGLQLLFHERENSYTGDCDVACDVIANAFYFLAAWEEQKLSGTDGGLRHLFSQSVFQRLGIAQSVVDDYFAVFEQRLDLALATLDVDRPRKPAWPEGATFAVVLSHDVDFIPSGYGESLMKGFKTVARDVFRHRDPGGAVHTSTAFVRQVIQGQNPYRQVPHMIAREKKMGVQASYQVAVGRRHPSDVSYRIEDDEVCDYLRVIVDEGFDLCLHGSYRSTERLEWYVEEARLLEERLGRPIGSRQHFLAFHYSTLFRAQEQAGIAYDMSIGFPDRTGFRTGFSHPFFPYDFGEERAFDVLEISLFLMDVTLRSYLGLRREEAWAHIREAIAELKGRGGCGSIVWHPIVFGNARDPGYAQLFWDTVDLIREEGGYATDGRTINNYYRGFLNAR